tara:strand:- start:530 stop:1279 length:750 start_codon:yes stop_codon:yes gene_type:complete
MPVMPAPEPAGTIFLVGTTIIMTAILLWWAFGGERKRHGWILPLVFAGTALSAVMIEPIYDNTLLYWYPDENSLAFFRGFERTIPWYVPLGYAWFFGGTAYLVWRVIESGVSAGRIWQLFLATAIVDWLAVSICEWMELSAFYGNQPFHIFGSPIWFSFCDATGGFVLGAALAVFVPYLEGAKRLWLLILPSFTYASTLGSTTAPVSLALNSNWSTLLTWAAGAATMILCMIAIHVIAQMAVLRQGANS